MKKLLLILISMMSLSQIKAGNPFNPGDLGFECLAAGSSCKNGVISGCPGGVMENGICFQP